MIRSAIMTMTIQLKENCSHINSQEKIANVINESMLYDATLKNLHIAKGFKFYVFNNLYPIEKTGIYEKGRIYTFSIRSMNKMFLLKLQLGLKRVENNFMKVIAMTQPKNMSEHHISELYTFNPAIITITDNNKIRPYSIDSDGVQALQDKIVNNLKKKYIQFTNKNIDIDNPIKGIEILSKTPVKTAYKNKTLLGYKLKLYINDDYDSQQLANIALGCGIAEKNSCLGAGYVEAR